MVKVEDSSLFMSSIGANQFPDRWATFVHELKATTPEGEPVKLESLSGAKWKVHVSDGSYVKLHYEVYLNHEDHEWSGGVDGAAYARDAITPTTTVMYLVNQDITTLFNFHRFGN